MPPTTPRVTACASRLVCTALALALGAVGCRSSSAPTPSDNGPHLAVSVAPLQLPGIGRACYDLALTDQAGGGGDVIWSRGDPALKAHDMDPGTPDDTDALCSDRYGGSGPAGDITFSVSCDAGSNTSGPDGVSQQTNSVLLWVDGLYDTHVPALPLEGVGQRWRNPCAYDATKPLQGACLIEAPCVENKDRPVRFNLTIMRDATGGFFDSAVTFEDVFCSIKVDCSRETPNGEAPIMLLSSPIDGHRLPSVVLGFACTGGPSASTYLYLSEYLDCGNTVIPLPLAGPAGNVYSATSPAPYPLLQLATFRGIESLTNPDNTPLDKIHFDTALAFDFAHLPGACNLVGTLTAADGPFSPSFTTPNATLYPIVLIDVPLVTDAQATGYACLRHPLGNSPADRVWSSYTRLDEPVRFDYLAHEVAGDVAVEQRVDLTVDLAGVMSGIQAVSEHYALVVTGGQPAPFVILGQSASYTLQGGILSRWTR